MFKILYFLVTSFFFFLIFSFSHIFYLFGSDFILSIFARGGYEGIKSSIVLIYGILFGIWIFIYLIKYKIYKEGKKILFIMSIISFFLIISTILSINMGGSIIGLSEKFHGLLFYFSLILFFIAIYFGFEKTDYKKIFNYIFIFSFFVYIYGFIQFLGLDPLSSLYETRVNITRASSFLGNANYLAGYILILLPLNTFIEKPILRKTFILVSIFILLATASYLGILLGCIYMLYLLYFYNKKVFIFSLVFCVIALIVLFNLISIEKFGSMMARPYIWETTILAIIDSPKTILFGYGPDTLQLVFNNFKVPELSIYETNYYTADRSHNLFLDFIYFFGLFGGGLISYFLLKPLRVIKDNSVRLSLIFFLIFFSFNIAVSIHFALILLILGGVYSKKIMFK